MFLVATVSAWSLSCEEIRIGLVRFDRGRSVVLEEVKAMSGGGGVCVGSGGALVVRESRVWFGKVGS